MRFRGTKNGKSKVLSDRLCLFDSGALQRALQFLRICRSNVNSCFSAPEPKKQSPLDTTIYLPKQCVNQSNYDLAPIIHFNSFAAV